MAAAKSNKNWFAIGVSAAVVVVLAGVAILVGTMNMQAGAPGATPVANDSLNAETGGISFGDGEETVAVFVDFHCPACKNFEDQYGGALADAAASGAITLEYHPIAILDHASQGSDYSSRAAGAAVCVAESNPDLYLDFSTALFENQMPGTAGLTNEQLADLAAQTGADGAVSCITDETYRKFGAFQAKNNDVTSTPTVKINGDVLDLQNAADFKRFTDLVS